jgi:RNA polymerase sigma factor (TIGR02999 family)
MRRTRGKVHEHQERPMTTPSSNEVTALLLAWNSGDQSALEKLMPLVYDELRRLARNYMSGERQGHVLQTTALVNEAYLRLIDSSRVQWQNRAHFFAVSCQLMRRVLVDVARTRNYQKRGGGALQISLHEAIAGSTERPLDLIALDDALTSLAATDERASRVVELRFFGGLSIEETAEVLKVSPETVKRDWNWAKAWLLREISQA